MAVQGGFTPGSIASPRLAWRQQPFGREVLVSETQKAGSGQLFCGQRKRSAYLTCLPIRPAISNMETWGLPKTSLSLASALIMRLLAASCSLLALM